MRGLNGYFADPKLVPVYEKVMAGERLSREDGLTLYRSSDLLGVGYLADLVRRRLHGNRAYYIYNQHL
ncbi:MAG: aminofutalosine synthase MqnE, partial [Deltaproteobacteria bacterium]|nr:aminofutalosine synthase MqnE [Deltaproteobacteria bacterium]